MKLSNPEYNDTTSTGDSSSTNFCSIELRTRSKMTKEDRIILEISRLTDAVRDMMGWFIIFVFMLGILFVAALLF